MKELINQIFEIEQKSKDMGTDKLDRNIRKIYSILDDEGYAIENPIGKKYSIQDTYIEANFIDETGQNIVSKVMKPAIFKKTNDQVELIQKAIVVVG
jgi:hypothetical protein